MTTDQMQARLWAASLLRAGQAVILDSETTGLDRTTEPVQIAVVDLAGKTLLNTLVRPTRPIPAAATAIHGIADADVAAAPTFPEVMPALLEALAGREVVIYNARYDLGVLTHAVELAGRPAAAFAPSPTRHQRVLFGAAAWTCAMTWYAQFVGQWNQRTKSYRWQPLPGGDHTALGDALATLQLIRRMSGEGDF